MRAEPAARVGDDQVTYAKPRAGRALACGRRAPAEPARNLPWIRGRFFDPRRKPRVDGGSRASGGAFELTHARWSSFRGNGIPRGVPVGTFPVRRGDDAFGFAPGAALIGARLSGRFDATPRRRRSPACIGSGLPVAIALNGVAVLPAFDGSGRDMVAREVHDRCGGRTDERGRYGYRVGAPCLAALGSRRLHSPQIGWARDGFPLFGPRGRRGERLAGRNLDACHGHTHPVRVRGRVERIYHYHTTPDFPYTLGCFRGTPSKSWRFRPLSLASAPAAASGPVAGGPGDAAAAPDPVDVELFPDFDVAISDYVARCPAGRPIRVSVAVPGGATVAIDGGPAVAGSATAVLDVPVGGRFELTVASGGSTTTHHVRCLPEDFPSWQVTRPGEPQAEWYVVTPTLFGPASPRYVAVFDGRGVPVWWYESGFTPIDAGLLPNGNFAWGRHLSFTGFETDPDGAYEERALDGTLVRVIRTAGLPTDHHDIQMTAAGNYLLLSYKRRDGVDLTGIGGPGDATVLDAEIQEVSPEGDVVWSWNSNGRIALDETPGHWRDQIAELPDGTSAYDLVHPNSVEEDGDLIVLSARHLDAVYAIERDTGDVSWKLGGTPTPQSLTIVGDDLAPGVFGGQHDARILDDGTLTLHDNGTKRLYQARAARYELDTVAGTATLLEEITDPQVPGFTFCCGGTRKLPAGNWVTSWGGTNWVTETAPGGERVFALELEASSYRANPVLPGVLSRAALRAGMDAMNPR